MTEKPVIDVEGEEKQEQPKGIKIDNGNAPILTAKFLSHIFIELKRIADLLEKQSE